MNWDQVASNWDQFKGKLRTKWAKLTDDDLQLIKGRRDVLAGKLRERYALQKDKVDKDIDEWLAGL